MIADQPIRYKGDGSVPGPFDYFLAYSALCAAYYFKLYCHTRDIPADNIRLSQNISSTRKPDFNVDHTLSWEKIAAGLFQQNRPEAGIPMRDSWKAAQNSRTISCQAMPPWSEVEGFI